MISVIIPTYNRQHTLARAMDSVLDQTHKPFEIIVIDDGSEDDTKLLIQQKYPQIRYFYQSNKGVSAARNHGIDQAQGSWLAFLDSDDAWHPEKLKQQMTALSKNPDYACCHTDELWYRNGKRVNPMKKHAKRGGWIFQYCLPMCRISPSSILLKKDLLAQIGYFTENLPACEDYDLWLRLTAHYPILYLDTPLTIKYGGHGDQLSKQYWGMDRFRIQALMNILNNFQLKEDDKQAALTVLQEKLYIYLQGAKKRGKTAELNYYQQLYEEYCQ